VGAAILHHIIDPSSTIKACADALKPGGSAVFFEPFEVGYVILRILYEQLMQNRRALNLSDEAVGVFEAIRRDVEVRTGSNKSDPIYQTLDDKWLFTVSYFEQQRQNAKFSRLQIIPIDSPLRSLSAQVATHLRLCLGADASIPQQAWDFIESFEKKFSPGSGGERMLEACVIFTK
jgi:hypothetical protein